MNKNLFWQYHEGSDSYDLYFNAFGDDNIIAGIADTGDGWEYGSTLLGVDNDFLDADNLVHLGISSSKSLHATTPFKEKRSYVA